MSQADNSVDRTSFRDSIPESHQPTFTLLQQLIEELVPDADVSIKWDTSSSMRRNAMRHCWVRVQSKRCRHAWAGAVHQHCA